MHSFFKTESKLLYDSFFIGKLGCGRPKRIINFAILGHTLFDMVFNGFLDHAT